MHGEQHLLSLGLLLIAGYLFGIVANKLRLPRITGYISAGLLLSSSISGVLNKVQIETQSAIVADITLSIIAFAIGGNLQMSRVRSLAKSILWITVTQSTGAFILVSTSLYVVGYFSPMLSMNGPTVFLCAVLVMGAISVTTAPAAVMAVVHETEAHGPLTTTLLGIVALDDAVAILLFSAMASVTHFLTGAEAGASAALSRGVSEIAGALVIGAMAGYILPTVMGSLKRAEVQMVIVLGFVFFVSGVCSQIHFSPLLANMTMGFAFVNSMKQTETVFHQLETVEEPLYCLFFAMAGALFDIGVLTTTLMLGMILFFSRCAGKVLGTIIGGRIANTEKEVSKYLGFSLMPQAGLSLGLIVLTREFLPETMYILLFNAVLASVIINELVAPPLVRWALKRAGEVHSEDSP